MIFLLSLHFNSIPFYHPSHWSEKEKISLPFHTWLSFITVWVHPLIRYGRPISLFVAKSNLMCVRLNQVHNWRNDVLKKFIAFGPLFFQSLSYSSPHTAMEKCFYFRGTMEWTERSPSWIETWQHASQLTCNYIHLLT